MEPNIVYEASEVIVSQLFNLDLWSLILKAILGIISLLILKYIGESISSYILLQLGGHIIKGTTVEINFTICKIRKLGVFTIVLETANGWMPIATRNWKNISYIKLKDNIFLDSNASNSKSLFDIDDKYLKYLEQKKQTYIKSKLLK